ncbi:ADP-dependent glucokinase [Anabrus simplex]|uniref:ADP-dependent glucokinase n=1 Tax=Anabrus simplex TaxID=316456 RepID=UPI0034DCFF69
MASGAFRVGTAVSFIAVFVAIYYRNFSNDVLKVRLNSVLQGLVEVERQHSVRTKAKVAIGYGACQDLFVDGKDLLMYDVAAMYPEHFSDISTTEELLKTYAYFFRHGAAAERYVSNGSLFDTLVANAEKMNSAHYGLGGNAPVMASRFHLEGCEVLLAAKMTDELQKTLPKGVRVVGGDVQKDDIHLILEYKADEEWGSYTSPRANRFIIHNDQNNPFVSSLEAFGEELKKFNPSLLVVSGLQMMDMYPFAPGEREKRLAKIRDQMIDQSQKTRIHFEMASFVEEELLKQLADGIIPYADSLGMNEQELANLYNTVLYGNISLVADSNPRVAIVLDQMRQIFRLLTDRNKHIDNSRQLTRLHVHTLAYQAILTVRQSPWRNSKAAAAKASLTANRHVCGSTEVDIDNAMLIMDESFSTSITAGSPRVPLDINEPISCWEESLENGPEVEICVAPVLVCLRAHQTAGGGDNISSAGLSLQI